MCLSFKRSLRYFAVAVPVLRAGFCFTPSLSSSLSPPLSLPLALPPSLALLPPAPSLPIKGGLEQALNSLDCLSPPLRWVRLPLELLPPPAPAPNPTRRSSSVDPLDTATDGSVYQRSRGYGCGSSATTDRSVPLAEERTEGGRQSHLRGSVPRPKEVAAAEAAGAGPRAGSGMGVGARVSAATPETCTAGLRSLCGGARPSEEYSAFAASFPHPQGRQHQQQRWHSTGNSAENSAGVSGTAENIGRGTCSNDFQSAHHTVGEPGTRGDPVVTNPGKALPKGGKRVFVGSTEGGVFVAGEEDDGKSNAKAQEVGGGRDMGGRIRQREVADMWWLTGE